MTQLVHVLPVQLHVHASQENFDISGTLKYIQRHSETDKSMKVVGLQGVQE